jgi:hypothetical protein
MIKSRDRDIVNKRRNVRSQRASGIEIRTEGFYPL